MFQVRINAHPTLFISMENIMTTHEKLIALLDQHQARYRVMEHEATGKCEAVAAIRGTEVGQGAKALVCHVKGNGIKQHVLAVLPADQQADLSKVAAAVGGRRASLASPAEVDALTGCVFGAIPRLVSILIYSWWSIRCCLNVMTKSPSMPDCWSNR
jgi:Ala-tRNA(Pro) deacylase